MPAAQSALVIGGGIAGPVAATALVMAGIDAAVYEARPADPASADGIGGSLALEPNGLAALRIVGADGDGPCRRGPDHAVRHVDRQQARPRDARAARAAAAAAHRPRCAAPHSAGPRSACRRANPPRQEADSRRRAPRRCHRPFRRRQQRQRRRADRRRRRALGRSRGSSTPKRPSARYLGMLGFEGLAERRRSDTADMEPGTMTFAFGRRAYYLYWKRPDGRIGWGANLPSPQYLSLKEARAVPAEDWLHTLRTAYADDVPGARLAAETTSDTLQAVGGLHIMPPVPHWHRGRMVLVGDAVHAPSNSTGQGASLAMESAIELARCLRDRARCINGIRRLRKTAAAAGGEDRRPWCADRPGQGAGTGRPTDDAPLGTAHAQGDEHREDVGRRTALHDRLGFTRAGGCFGTRMILVMRVA